MRLDLLKIITDHLEFNVPEREFNINNWMEERSCGTDGCVIGHACNIPAIHKAGLWLFLDEFNSYIPVFEDKAGFQAVESFLEIHSGIANYLFSPSGYKDSWEYFDDCISKETVVKRLRGFIAAHSSN